MIERLPTPWGLVRLGVAPDHPKLKTVSRAFERIAAKPGFRFFGNVEVGRDLSHADLARLYDAVIYAFGAQSDRRLGIPGEELPGSLVCHRVRGLVQRPPRFPGARVRPRRRAGGRDRQRERRARRRAHARPHAARSWPRRTRRMRRSRRSAPRPSREIVDDRRRGPAQAAFTTPELKELGELAGADVVVDPAELELDAASEASLEHDTNAQRNMEVLREFRERERRGQAQARRAAFLRSPVAIHGEERVESIELVRNRLEDGDGRLAAVADRGARDARVRARLSQRRLPRRRSARPAVRRAARHDPERRRARDRRRRRAVPGLYCAGWIKRARAGSSARTRRMRTRPWTSCSRTSGRSRLPRDEVNAERGRGAARGARRAAVMYAGWSRSTSSSARPERSSGARA